MKGLGVAALIAVSVVVLFVIMTAASLAFRWEIAPWIGAVEQREIVEGSGEFRINSYNHFYDLCATIQQTEARHDTQFDELEAMNSGTDNYDRQRRTVSVLEQRIEVLKRKYNADASKEATLAAFKSNDLPNRIEPLDHEHGRRTECVWGD